ncbi:MAG TPA: sigma-70 family RNA polymerase sigma factor, partial [Flavisolibacter sp.]|nr:sigma-70 family RNA polymerase sigma factor [Flavisolibacter sp.]
VRRYNQVLYKVARTYGLSHHDAEDLMQDTHVAAYFALKNIEMRSSYKTWITRIMINKCLYRLKSNYYRNEMPSGNISDLKNAPVGDNTGSNQSEETVLYRELAMLMEKSLQSIPEMYRTVFVLREIEGFSVTETAQLLDLTAANVKVRLSRAKMFLRKDLNKFYCRNEVYSFNLIYCDGVVSKVLERVSGKEEHWSSNCQAELGSI